MPSSSSNSSTTIPLSFDRFRGRSIQFLSPFRNHHHHHHDKRIKQSPERSWLRKIQVHPNQDNSNESDQTDHDVAYLFHANKYSNSKTLSKNSQNKKCPKNLFDNRPTSNVSGLFDVHKLPITNASQPKVLGSVSSPTPCMIRYRNSSLPNLIPTRIIKYPKIIDDSFKQSDIDHFNA